ncbi:hypothetical protein RFI_14209 [Reticulomyxa filosa]|uniref:NAD-dependent epimerase/dehydratase domain-containing protein n=1 Tax=Reticulomyxa filosa TaxID=46433 RepID=X6NAE2_RETFI|nr:hypothetical protein RFI_14209 [Reticulomyxa filosa]|eukprot:ETO22981.1 hypothetical protein RFI_14209 [Reticulomyxa filosa]
MSQEENAKTLVLVIGASGFIAGHIIKQLCERGYQVRGTVRKYKKENYEYLLDLQKRQGQIEFIECDLTKDDNWDEAVKGVKYVIHTANPMPDTDMSESGGFGGGSNRNKTPLTDDDYIKPAVDGMTRILNAIRDHGKSIKRIVYTSSIGSINWECWDTVGTGKKIVYTHSGTWTPIGRCHVNFFQIRFTLAEQLGFEFVKKHDKYEFTTILPGLVVGPLLNDRKPMSMTSLQMCLNGEYPVVPRIQWGVVDVREVATAHVNAMTAPNAPGKRYLLVGECLWYKDMVELMAYKYSKLGYPVPTMEPPEFVVKLLSYIDPEIGNFVLPINNLKRFVDHRPSVEDLDVIYRPPHETIIEACEDLIKKGHVRKPPSTLQRAVKKGAIVGVGLTALVGSVYIFGGKEKLEEIKSKILG